MPSVLEYHHSPMEMETMTEGIAVGAALVSYTALTADGCDCMGVCDWTHSAMLCASWDWTVSTWWWHRKTTILVPRKTTEF